MNKLKNMKIFFHIFTFEKEDKEDSKDLKIKDVKRKVKFWVRDYFLHRDNFVIFNTLYQELKYAR